MDQDVQFRVEELEQNVQAKDRELAQSQQELRQKVYRNTEVFSRTFISHYVRMYICMCRRHGTQKVCKTAAIHEIHMCTNNC